MTRKKIDNRIRVLIENGVHTGHRTMFVIVGEKGRDQVVILHHMLSKTTVKARPSVLWCYKKELGFSSHRKKRMRQLQKKIKSGKLDVNEEDPFELFIAATNIRYCYYHETHKILGNTYGMLVLQDFEAMTPNILARTIETIEGGGLVVLLLQSVTSLRQLYTLTMDVHSRYRTEAHKDVVGRFNERFILSLSSCESCLVVDDQLTILPVSSHVANITPVSRAAEDQEAQELSELKESLQDTQPLGVLINCCSTCDQAQAVLKFVDAITEKTFRTTVAVTAARGRGKSAALGLAVAGAVAFGYSNIFVTAPSPENLKTLFEFVLKGFDALKYEEHQDYEVVQSTNPELNKAVVRVTVSHEDHRQVIQYVHPSDAHLLGQAELLVIDEAAAIPLPLVQKLLGSYLVFLSSTINGYEGTGRSLSLKLIQQLRQQSVVASNDNSKSVGGRTLYEVSLNESIRYKPGDAVEKWLNQLLCLDATVPPVSGCPPPQDCQLFYVNRDTLFSYHKASEAFLQQVVSLYVASHYKNSPNDLQMLSDAPAHHLFVLLAPVHPSSKALPQVLCVLQVCYEGGISKSSVSDSFSRGRRAHGDLIPWTVSQQFQDEEFAGLAGARVVRIATHPEYQRMGYGLRALELLTDYYLGHIPSLEEKPDTDLDSVPLAEEDNGEGAECLEPRKALPPLLLKLSEKRAEQLDYLGVSYGLTADLLKFWKKAGYIPVYLRQTPNDLTGEHSCIMLKCLQESAQWLPELWKDFKRRFLFLLGYQFRELAPATALSVLRNPVDDAITASALTLEEVERLFSVYDIKRLELYSQNLVDHHLITDLLPTLAQQYFLKTLGDMHLSAVQSAILLSLGLQHSTADALAKVLDLPCTQLLGLFNRVMRKCSQFLRGVLEKTLDEALPRTTGAAANLQPVLQSLNEELAGAAKEIEDRQKRELKKLQQMDLSQYSIKGSESEWKSALEQPGKQLVSIKTINKRPQETETQEKQHKKKKKK